MRRTLAIALASLTLAVAVVPTANAGPLPPNPFDNVACSAGGGPGLIGYVSTIFGLTCGYALSVGSVTYDFACFVVQGGC